MFKNFFEKNQDGFYVVFRVLIGFMLFVHGAQKFSFVGDMSIQGFATGMGLPFWLAWLVAFAELVGGLGIVLGVFTRFSAFIGAIIMATAFVLVHLPKDWTLISGGGELAFLYLASFLVLMVHGAKCCSIEKAVVGKELF